MLSALRDRLPDVRDDAGLTLTELIVAMTLSMIVMAITLNFFIGSLTSSAATTSQSIDTAQARVILDNWSSLIRIADANGVSSSSPAGSARFALPDADDLVFYANVGNLGSTSARTAPTLIWLSLSDGQLIQKAYRADSPNADPSVIPATYSTYPASPATTQILAGCSSSTAATACGMPGTVSSGGLFAAYYSATGCPSTALSSAGLCTIDPNSPGSLNDAVAIGISFTVTANDGQHGKTFTTLASVSGGSSS